MRTLLRNVGTLALAIAVSITSGMAASADSRSTYVILPKSGAAAEVRQLIASVGEFPEDQLSALDDMFIIDLLPEDVAIFASSPAVEFIEQDAPVSNEGVQSPTPSWGLDQIDGVTDSAFSYPDQSGAGVIAYVFDTGVAADHPDLVGRVTQGFDVVTNNQANTDCHFHGTHVAATIAGTSFGVAKQATVVPLKVLDCRGSGFMTGVVRAINWTIANHPQGTPGVANLSLGGNRTLSVNAAIANLVDRGVTTVVAAGNERTDACKRSPASAPEAITVGASDRFENRASFSNFGECVDIFAPGVSIPSADARDYSKPLTLSGTSMAAPHVAGVAALILGANPSALPDQVEAAIYRLSKPGVIKNSLTDRGNRLAVSPAEGAAPIPTLSQAPTGLTVTGNGQGYVDFAWDAVPGALGYQVEFRRASQNTFTIQSTQATQFRVEGMSGAEDVFVRVRATADQLVTRFSPAVVGRSATEAASAPRNPRITATSLTSMVMSWDPPSYLGGAASLRYRVEIKTDGDWRSINNDGSRTLNISSMNVPHHFRVYAVNEAGSSAPSEQVTFDSSQVFLVQTISATVEAASNLNISWVSNAPAESMFEVSVGLASGTQPPVVSIVRGGEHRVIGLAKLATYRVSVVPLGSIRGLGLTTQVTTQAVPASAPRSISSERTESGWQIRFSAPSDNGGAPITAYVLQRFTDGQWVEAQTGLQLTFKVSVPTRGQSHDYRVLAVNSAGISAPSSTVRITTPAARASSPIGFAAELQSDGRVVLSWQAPADDGGSAVSAYRLETLRNGTWITLGSTSNQNFAVAALAKGTTASYRVSAANSAGVSDPSEAIEVSRPATVASDITNLSVSLRDGVISLTWSAPRDLGGSGLLGYRIEQRSAEGWTQVGDLVSAATHTLPLGAPGTRFTFRVLAVNGVGAANSGNERSINMPFAAASAPRNFAVTAEGARQRFSWDAPADLGGSTLSSFVISASTDGGPFLRVATLRSSDRTALVPNPAPGKTTLYRIAAETQGFAAGTPSDPIAVAMPATAPADPQTVTAAMRAGEGILLSWTAPISDGGSALLEYRVELSVGRSWTLVGTTTGTSLMVPAGAPGESLLHRVVAVNQVGVSPGTRNVLTRMGVAPATAPLGLTATVSGSRLNLAWQAPEIMGGVFSSYEIQVLENGSFRRLGTSRSLGFSASVPGHGLSSTFRVAAVTNAGIGALSEPFTFTNPKVAPGAPVMASVRSVGYENTITWRTTSIFTGGGTVDQAVLYRDQGGVFVEVARTSATAGTLSFENNLFGQSHRYVLRFTNEVGESNNSTPWTLRHAIVASAPATSLRAQASGSSVQLSWAMPEFTGGSDPSFVDIQSSVDGQNWVRVSSIRVASSALVSMPAKGTTLSYRVILRNSAGNSAASDAVTFTNPLTAPSAILGASATRVGNVVQFRITAPIDFGGYSSLLVNIERQGALAWQSSQEFTLIRAGASATFSLPLPAARGTYNYRVVVTNPSGEVDRIVTFRY